MHERILQRRRARSSDFFAKIALQVPLRFEWDPRKAAGNLAQHGVPFEEAASVFLAILLVASRDDLDTPAMKSASSFGEFRGRGD